MHQNFGCAVTERSTTWFLVIGKSVSLELFSCYQLLPCGKQSKLLYLQAAVNLETKYISCIWIHIKIVLSAKQLKDVIVPSAAPQQQVNIHYCCPLGVQKVFIIITHHFSDLQCNPKQSYTLLVKDFKAPWIIFESRWNASISISIFQSLLWEEMSSSR